MKAVEPIVDGRYLQAETQKAALAAAAELPLGALAEGRQAAAAPATGASS
jgi:NAD(P)H-quinone oxidoreductase subunit K